MNNHDLHSISESIADLLRIRLEGKESCVDVIEAYESLAGFIWDFVSRFAGSNGTRALIVRSTKLTGRKVPLVNKLQVSNQGIDFTDLRAFVEQVGCDRSELVNALVRLSVRIFWVLDELTGEALHGPLLRYLKEDNPSENSICGRCDSNGKQG